MKINNFYFVDFKRIDVKNYYYRSCSSNIVYRNYKISCSNSDEIAQNIIMLPLNKEVSIKYQKRIINEIKYFFG